MRISKILYAAVAISLIAIVAIPRMSMGQAAEVARLLDRADRIAKEAQRNDGDIAQSEKFQEAIKLYQRVAKEGNQRPEAAIALLNAGKVQAGVPIESTPANPEQVYKNRISSRTLLIFPSERTLQDPYAARETMRQLLQKFDKPERKLIDDYGREDADRILNVVEQARQYSDILGNRINDQNKGKLLYQAIDVLVKLTGSRPGFSYWFAIILLTVIVKVAITPLTKAQFKSMKEMQKLAPLVKQIQEKYKGDQAEIGKRTMDLYKEHGVNPLSGCLPLLVQFPILIGVYTAIRYYEVQFAQGTFLWIGWEPLVHKLSVPLMGRPVWLTAGNLAQPDLILLLLYTVSMIISQRLSAVDPTQAEQQKMLSIMMPLMFFFIIGYLPSAFVLYWFTFNLLQTWQQYHIIHGTSADAEVTPAPSESVAEQQRPRQSGRRRRRR